MILIIGKTNNFTNRLIKVKNTVVPFAFHNHEKATSIEKKHS